MSKSVETKTRPVRPKLPARRPSMPLMFAVWPARALLRGSVWRPVVRLSAAGEGVFTSGGLSPQELFSRKSYFFAEHTEQIEFT